MVKKDTNDNKITVYMTVDNKLIETKKVKRVDKSLD